MIITFSSKTIQQNPQYQTPSIQIPTNCNVLKYLIKIVRHNGILVCHLLQDLKIPVQTSITNKKKVELEMIEI